MQKGWLIPMMALVVVLPLVTAAQMAGPTGVAGGGSLAPPGTVPHPGPAPHSGFVQYFPQPSPAAVFASCSPVSRRSTHTCCVS